MNTLGAIFKPEIICPFPVMSTQPLWSDSVPFGLSAVQFRLLLVTTLEMIQHMFLRDILILTNCLIWTIKFLHIVLRTLHLSITTDAYLSRITPNVRGSTRQFMMQLLVAGDEQDLQDADQYCALVLGMWLCRFFKVIYAFSIEISKKENTNANTLHSFLPSLFRAANHTASHLLLCGFAAHTAFGLQPRFPSCLTARKW